MKKTVKVGVCNEQGHLIGYTNHATEDPEHLNEFERGIIRNLVFTDEEIKKLDEVRFEQIKEK